MSVRDFYHSLMLVPDHVPPLLNPGCSWRRSRCFHWFKAEPEPTLCCGFPHQTQILTWFQEPLELTYFRSSCDEPSHVVMSYITSQSPSVCSASSQSLKVMEKIYSRRLAEAGTTAACSGLILSWSRTWSSLKNTVNVTDELGPDSDSDPVYRHVFFCISPPEPEIRRGATLHQPSS